MACLTTTPWLSDRCWVVAPRRDECARRSVSMILFFDERPFALFEA
jgi:hypothetical protein